MRKCLLLLLLLLCAGPTAAERILIPMDLEQRDHLKAYGVAFWTLERSLAVEWLLNYRGGAFLIEYNSSLVSEAQIRTKQVTLEQVNFIT